MADVLTAKCRDISDLPESVILEIFRYLPMKSLCTIGRVCRQWRRVTKDNSLWRHVNLLPHKLNLNRMWKVIRAHFSDVLLSLHLCGYMDPAGINWKKNSLSDAMLHELEERCPRLALLELDMTNLSSVSSASLPASLTSLIITSSLMPAGWYKDALSHNKLASLTTLDLSNSTKTCDLDLIDLSVITGLEVLKLNGCYRVKQRGLTAVTQQLLQLTQLEISSTKCDSVVIHTLCRNLNKLTVLNLSRCESLKTGDFVNIALSLKLLECLSVRDCEAFTKDNLLSFRDSKNLKLFDLAGTQAEAQLSIDEVKMMLPDCQIISDNSNDMK